MSKSKATTPLLIEANNLSHGWARILLHITDNPGKEITPLIFSLTGFGEDGTPYEESEIKAQLDDLLCKKEHINIEDVAYTIFPQRLWIMAQGDRQELFKYYRMAFPSYQAMKRHANGRGLYFQRLTMYEGGPDEGNQLEWILNQYNGRKGVRKSMFQATTFDPRTDHVATAQLGFPCLQHVSFEPTNEGLVLNAFYATQQIFNKAYGNYLGLARLGAFMAHEMSLPLIRMNVIVGVAKLERIKKSDTGLKQLVDMCRTHVENNRTK